MRILIMYKTWAGYLPRFVEEAKKLGAQVRLAHFTDLTLKVERGQAVVKVSGTRVENFDLVYVRSVGKYHEEMTILADYCKTHKVKLLERALVHGNVDRDHKSYEALKLLEAGLGYPVSFFGNSPKILRYLKLHTNWPVVIKDTGGRRGRAVYKVDNLNLARKIFQGRVKRNYVVQEYIENDGEYRVWVVGGKIIGAMHRPSRIGEFEIVGISGKSKTVKLSKAMRDLAIKATEALEVDVAGIDMVKDIKTGQPYVLEVNRAAVFGTFERVTNINVVEKIVQWLLEQLNQ